MNGHAIIAAVLSLALSSTALASRTPLDRRRPYDSERDMVRLRHDLTADLLGGNSKLRQRSDRALGAMVKLATWKLRREGHRQDANQIQREWDTEFAGVLSANTVDLGDHAALNGWVQALYIYLEYQLGTPMMEMLHLDDLNIINMAWPVVFHMEIVDPDPIDSLEYGKHFEPLCGVLAYWAVFIGCTAGTSGTAGLLCSPAGMLAEFVTVEWTAPPFTPYFWEKFYQ